MLAMTVGLLANEHASEYLQHVWSAESAKRNAMGPFQAVEDAPGLVGDARIVKGEKEDSQLAMSEASKFFLDYYFMRSRGPNRS